MRPSLWDMTDEEWFAAYRRRLAELKVPEEEVEELCSVCSGWMDILIMKSPEDTAEEDWKDLNYGRD